MIIQVMIEILKKWFAKPNDVCVSNSPALSQE